MNYTTNPKNGEKISRLAYGCMRFPRDFAQAEQQVLHAIELGVNYFDTAYVYPGNEATLGRILAKNNCRDNINIATKLPHYFVKKREDFDSMFSKQLERLQTNHIDYYLIHMLTSTREWDRMKALGILEWLEGKLASGQIRNLGFSYHGGVEEFKGLVDAHNWDFCMIQYNYYDENNQAGQTGLHYAAEKGLPVMIMEPLRGGRLVNRLPEEALALWRNAPGQGYSPAAQAFRWLWNQPEVFTVLSGMNSMEMIDENCKLASSCETNFLTPEELELFSKVRQVLTEKTVVPCTGCNYCMPCPFGVDIPTCFNIMNDRETASKLGARFNYIVRANNHQASLCTKCGKCETHCPQKIAIRQELAGVKAALESFPYKPMRGMIKKLMRLT